eukprot:125352_1
MSFVHDTSICKYYNPYFDSDCDKGSKCPFRHLQSDQFIGYCTKLHREYPFSASDRAMSKMAYNLLKNGEYSQALRGYKQLLNLFPLSAVAAYRIGQCNEHMSKFKYAAISYRRAISSNPNVSAFHRDYANLLYLKLKNIDQAQYHFEEALRLKDDNAFRRMKTHQQYAVLLSKEIRDYDKAKHHYEQALELSSQCTDLPDAAALCIDLHANYASSLSFNRQDPEKIHHHFREALALSAKITGHTPFRTHYLYALYLKKIGDIERSKYHFEASITHKNDYGLSQFGLGELLCKSTDYIQGLKHIQIACKLQPQNRKWEHGWIKWNEVGKRSKDEQEHKRTPHICDETNNDDDDEYVVKRSKDEKEHKITTSAPQICDQTNNDRELGYSRREFNRFITEKVIAGAIGAKYVKQFETLQVNDLRYFEFIDAEYLKTQIGMNALHIRLCIKQMDKFKKNCKEFDEWLKSIDVYYEYSSLLASFGILTFEAFYKYMNTIDDIVHIIGTWNSEDAKYIFENAPRHCRQKHAHRANRAL